MPVHVTEPHPSVPQTTYIHSGRGGAGNYRSHKASTLTAPQTATGPASLAPLPHPSRTFVSGRGGAGNVHLGSERAMFSFDEELERMTLADAPVYHVGRGGAGNAVDERSAGSRNGSQGSASSTMSKDSNASEKAKKSIDWVRERLGRTSSRA